MIKVYWRAQVPLPHAHNRVKNGNFENAYDQRAQQLSYGENIGLYTMYHMSTNRVLISQGGCGDAKCRAFTFT